MQTLALVGGDVEELHNLRGCVLRVGRVGFSNNTKALDTSGHGNDGIVSGAPYSATDGGAYSFDRSNYIVSSNNVDFDAISAVGMWFNSSDANDWSGLIDHYKTNTDRWYLGAMVGENFPSVYTGAGSLSLAANNDYRNDGVWHYVVLSWNGSITQLYIDGCVQTQTSATNPFDGGDGGDIHIGAYWWDNILGNGINCAIDDVRVYNRTLSAAEIHKLYWQGKDKHR